MMQIYVVRRYAGGGDMKLSLAGTQYYSTKRKAHNFLDNAIAQKNQDKMLLNKKDERNLQGRVVTLYLEGGFVEKYYMTSQDVE